MNKLLAILGVVFILLGFGIYQLVSETSFKGEDCEISEDCFCKIPINCECVEGKCEEVLVDSNFDREGVLIKDNPGLKPNSWYLSYEEPGSSGLSVELVFGDKSNCILEEDIDCSSLNEDLIGNRVLIEGYKQEDQVWVYNLEKVEVGDNRNIQDIARDWITNNSPTFLYDGENLQFVEMRGLDLVGCENCYEIEYQFQSRHAGYGDREGENLAQVITSHNIVVLMRDGEVDRVVTDGEYDEINEELL